MFDMCDEYHFIHISTIYLGGYIQKLKFVDSILYVSYGGFVARYRLKEISPCQVYTWNDIKDFQHLKKIRVYPNPNYGNFKIDLNNKPYKIIRIFDIHGRVVYCQNIGNALYYENVNIYVDLPAGIYFLNLVTNHNTTTEKVIIK